MTWLPKCNPMRWAKASLPSAVWSDALMAAVPARHPLLKYKRIPLDEVMRYPLVLCDPIACEGHARQVERVLRQADVEPLIAERVTSSDLTDGASVGGLLCAGVDRRPTHRGQSRARCGRASLGRPLACANYLSFASGE